jgi:hypothetical protein
MKIVSLNISKFGPTLTHFELPPSVFPFIYGHCISSLHREIIRKRAANSSTDLARGTRATRCVLFPHVFGSTAQTDRPIRQ